MKPYLKILILAVADAVTLYLSFYVSYLAMDMIGIQGTESIISNAYIFVAIKLVCYAIFFMYSLNRYRSIFIDILGILFANGASIFAAFYLFQVDVLKNIVYFAIVFVFDAVIAIMIRYLVRTSDNTYDDDDEYEDDYPNRSAELNSNPYQSNLYQPQYQPDPLPSSPQPQAAAEQPVQVITVQDPELLEQQKEKDRKIDMLMDQLDEKEQRIQILENKITMQDNTAYQDYSSSETYIDRNKKEILDKILDDIKSLYSTLNTRAKLVEEREYNMLLKMVELEEKERALNTIQRENREAYPDRIDRYQRKRNHNASFPSPLALPRDNPDLANNIIKTLEILNSSTSSSAATPQITLASKANDEPLYHTGQSVSQQKSQARPADPSVKKAQPSRQNPKNETPLREQPLKQERPAERVQPKASATEQILKPQQQSQIVKQQNIEPAHRPSVKPEPVKTELKSENAKTHEKGERPQGMQVAKQLKPEAKTQVRPPQKQLPIDFNTIKTGKVDVKPEELDQISSLIDIL